MGSCSTGNCGGTNQMFEAPPPQIRGGPGQEAQQTGEAVGADGKPVVAKSCSDGSCGTASKSASSANGSCSGGSCGGGKAAYSRAGSCSSGSCGDSKSAAKAAKSAGGCSDGSCGDKDAASKAQSGKNGLLKATVMTVASTELAQLSIDYSQYIS